LCLCLSYLTCRPPPRPTLFPYTTLFRSGFASSKRRAFEQESRELAVQHYAENLHSTSSDVLAHGSGRMVGLASREFGELSEVGGVTHDGKPKYLHNQKLANERANRKIVRMLRERTERGDTHLTRRTVTPYR